MSAAEGLYLQLKDDYPEKAIKWVKDYNWDWPHAVPLDQIDFSHKDEWGAEENRKKIKAFKEKITKGLMKPSVLVKPKGSDLYVIVDGHHRGISNMELTRPMLAWTTNTDSKKGPWDVMHDQQVRGKVVKTSNPNLDAVLFAASFLSPERF
jgi:hypothetical protein